MSVYRPSRILVCSTCRRLIEPGQRFHVITDVIGQEKSFCQKEKCQTEMQKAKGQQSGGVKRPVIC